MYRSIYKKKNPSVSRKEEKSEFIVLETKLFEIVAGYSNNTAQHNHSSKTKKERSIGIYCTRL